MGYKMRHVNETGGDWMHDATIYADLDICEVTAMMAYDDEYVDDDDIIQAWEVDEDGDVVGNTAAAEWCKDNFSK